jgi:DNA-binding CsgD family transcriptional regulator
VARESGDRIVLARSLLALGALLRAGGSYEVAVSVCQQALGLQVEAGNIPGVVASLEALAGVAAERGHHGYAARLLAAVESWRQTSAVVLPPALLGRHRSDVALARKGLTSEELAVAWAEGAGLTLQDAIAYARRGRGPRRRPSTGLASLTPTERQVVDLAVEGLTNPEIAERLFISRRTVQVHVSHALAKLGAASRRELAKKLQQLAAP